MQLSTLTYITVEAEHHHAASIMQEDDNETASHHAGRRGMAVNESHGAKKK